MISEIFKPQIFMMISPVFGSVVKWISDKGSPAGPCNTFPVNGSYLEPWQGHTSCPLISWLIRHPAWVHLFEKTFSDDADFTTINLSNKNTPAPSFEGLILHTTGRSDSSFCLPVKLLHTTNNTAPAAQDISLRNVFRFINSAEFKSVYIGYQN